MPNSRCRPEQAQNLSLDRDIEGGGRLVGNDEVGPHISAMAIITRWRRPPES